MATFSDVNAVQLDTLAKDFEEKAARSSGFFASGEPIGSKNSTTAARVFMNEPPVIPPAESTADIAKHYPVEEGGTGVIRLTRDRDVADGTTWVALPTHDGAFGAGAASAETLATIMRDFLTDATAPGYAVKFYAPDGTWLPNGGIYRPSIDPMSGVVRFATPVPGATGADAASSPYIKAYRQVGATLASFDFETMGQETVEDNHFCSMMTTTINS